MDSKPRGIHPIVMIIYPARVIGYFVSSLALLSIFYKEDHSLFFWLCLGTNMYLWPHFAFLISRKSSNPKKAEYISLGIDSFMFGLWIALSSYNPWIFIVYAASSLAGNVGINGFNLSSKCFSLLLLGSILAGFFNDFQFNPNSSFFTIFFSTLAMFTFTCHTGFLIYARSRTLSIGKERLTEANNNIMRINRVVNAAGTSLNIDEMMQAMVPVLSELFIFDYVLIQLADREENVLKFYSIYGKYINENYVNRMRNLTIHIDGRDSIATKVLYDKNTVYVSKVTPDSEFLPIDREIYETKPFLSILILPIVIGEETIGVITFFSCYGYFQLSPTEIDSIKQYVSQISMIIKNSVLYHKIIEDQNVLNEKNVQLENISKQLSRYLSPQIYETIFSGKSEAKIESNFKPLTVFFSDIAGFTDLTDRIEAEVLTSLLNRYLTAMSEIAIKHGGTIDKYIGDAILIFFGDPESRGVEQDAKECVLMALEMQERLKILYKEWEDEGFPESIRIRIGINSGLCAVGNFGSEYRMSYSLIGNQVNIAIRLEAQGLTGEIIISESTYELTKNSFDCTEFIVPANAAYPHPLNAYQVIGIKT